MVDNADEQKRQRGIPSGPREFQESRPEKVGEREDTRASDPGTTKPLDKACLN